MFKTSVQVVHRILGRMMFSFSFFFTVEILAQGALSFTSLVLPSGQGIFFFLWNASPWTSKGVDYLIISCSFVWLMKFVHYFFYQAKIKIAKWFFFLFWYNLCAFNIDIYNIERKMFCTTCCSYGFSCSEYTAWKICPLKIRRLYNFQMGPHNREASFLHGHKLAVFFYSDRS